LQSAPDSFAACTSPTSYTTAVADGAYRFAVKGTDPAGNVTTASTTLVIDTVAPTVSAAPSGGQFAAAQSVVLTASEPATIYYTTDGTTPTTATITNGPSPVTVNVANSETLQYFAVDTAGNSGAIGVQKYQIGAVSITQHPASVSFSNTPTFAFTSTAAGSTIQCALNLQSVTTPTFTPCASPITYGAQPDGSYIFTVQGTDAAGDVSTSQFAFAINTAPPVVTITQNPPNPSRTATATFAFTADKPGTTFQCSLVPSTAANAFAACTSPTSFTTLDGQTYRFAIIGTDTGGNASAPLTYTFSVALLAPPTTTVPAAVLGLSGGTSTNGVPVSISWTGTACQNGTVSCNIASYHLQESVNGLAFADVTLPSPTATSIVRTLKPTAANNSTPVTTYAYRVQATDKQGNVSAFAIAPSFTLPDIDNSFNTSFNGSWSGANLTGAFGGSVQFSSTAGAFANPANPFSATSVAVVSTMGPDRGKAQITLDGVVVATVDLYSPTQQTAQIVWSTSGLKGGAATHTLKVTALNQKNAASSGTRVDYDAVLSMK
jgi:large repetitive protein